jgi:hypothetical protein
MRKAKTVGVFIGSAAICAATGLVLAGAEERAPASDAGFVVHEWGTFTSMQGADGVALEGLSREEEPLPEFVYSRSKVRDCPLRDKGWKGLEVPAQHVTQKMETPVIYFHSPTRRVARVRVDFMRGLISQWYPVSDLLGPPEGARDAGPLDVSKVERSFLQWDVEVRPEGEAAPGEVPDVSGKDPWAFARDVRASWLRTLPRKPPRAGPVEAERYLFYRGLGSFPMPLSATAERGGKLTISNAGEVPVGPTFVLEVDGARGRVAESGPVPARGAARVELRGGDFWGPIDDVERKLEAWVGERLVREGLADDEARAMVRTWSRSWFKSEGVRVIWIVPRATVDALLPLSIDPKPDALVRVLVGRLEVITPETADEVERAIRDRTSDDVDARAAARARLDRLGRFLEPHVRNALADTKDELVRKNAQALLAELGKSEDAK